VTLRTDDDIEVRLNARKRCADEINDRANRWLRFKRPGYAAYVELVRTHPQGNGIGACWSPVGQRSPTGTEKHLFAGRAMTHSRMTRRSFAW